MKPLGRTRLRKAVHSVLRPENSVDESFEDLLSKYKQIQLELECIRKEETMALEPTASPGGQGATDGSAAADPTEDGPGPKPASELESEEKRVFLAFNIKPLRQKLPTPAELDKLQKKWVEQEEGSRAEEGEPYTGRTRCCDADMKPCDDVSLPVCRCRGSSGRSGSCQRGSREDMCVLR